MNKATVFIHVQGRPGIVELELPLSASLDDIRHLLKAQARAPKQPSAAAKPGRHW